ncbi:hypothetical protein [Amycolatopsis ultiminotia]
MCYIEVASDGSVRWGSGAGTYKRALAGETRLYAVWPGEWSSHLFVIDDLDQYARAFGIVHDETRTGLADHQHQARWAVHPTEDKPNGAYITINVQLDCGCKIRDLKTFATQMRQQQGWNIATSGGWGGGGETYYMRARRKSLTT